MIEQFCPNPVVLQRLLSGPLRAHIHAIAQQLSQQGYTSSSAKNAMRLLDDLSSWLLRQALTAADFNEQLASEFLQDRYRRCRPHLHDRAALRRLLEHLRHQGIIPIPIVKTDTTVDYYLKTVQSFLRERFRTQPLNLEALCPQDITDFMIRQARRYSSGRAKLFATALRSFFRFLLQRGAIAHDLAQAVPTVPNWRLTTLPRFMKAKDVDGLLQTCDRTTSKGQRDDAIVLLLARLGLRAGEVAALTLDDLDWEAGELLIRGKSARHDRLPLPHEVGEAFAISLRHGRPPSAARQVFIRMRAPRRGFSDGQAVGTIVRRSLVQAGLNPALKGAHLLRHSLATTLLHNGASLTEIGELLRHQNIETTRIYAKVDQGALRALAVPWPGGDV